MAFQVTRISLVKYYGESMLVYFRKSEKPLRIEGGGEWIEMISEGKWCRTICSSFEYYYKSFTLRIGNLEVPI